VINEPIFHYAISLVGKPYRWGGSNALIGFDCSGLVLELLAAQGKWNHRQDASSQGIYDHFKNSSNGETKGFGTLYFYGKSIKQITHIAFGLDDKTMIEAGGGDSTTVSETAARERGAVVRLRPWNYRRDLVAFLNPNSLVIQTL
jgi:cell wall-associated NlpC family hydrolase